MNLFMMKKEDFKNINKTFIISRIMYWLIFILFALMVGDIKNTILHFDVEHYMSIAIRGYAYDMQYAFFPMLPIIISFFNLFKIPIMGTLIFNFIISYLTTIIIYKISKDIYKYKDKQINNIINFWCFSPVALFTMIPYTEGIFIFLTVLTYYLYKSGKSPVLVGIVLGLSVFTRSIGAMLFFALFIVLFIDLLRNYKYKFKEKFIYIIKLYIPATVISCIYPIYLYSQTGDFLYFASVQFTKWKRIKSNFLKMILVDFEIINKKNAISIVAILNSILLLSALFFICYLTYKYIKNKEMDSLLFLLYILFSLISFFSTMRYDGETMASCSIYRYIYSLFPLYLYKKGNIFTTVSKNIFIVFNFILIPFFVFNVFLF